MTDALRHRGPDDEGQWLDPAAGVALGHRRLSIIDLSPEGHQPMVSPSGRYVIVYNGEVYNFEELRRDLLAAGQPGFRGHSDTEVMLAAIERWGLVPAVGRMAGMFALALWDRQTRTLALVRDRMGEKPLYYAPLTSSLLFGSELKALWQHPAFDSEIDRGAAGLLLRHGYIPAPHTVYRRVRKVMPGTILMFRTPPSDAPISTVYWNLREAAVRGLQDPFKGDLPEALDELETQVRGTVRRQMTSDVPLGAFLSGGVDSSLIVALMQSASARPVRTFTIGFDEEGFNEAEHARAVARHIGTEHTELYVRAEDALAVVPKLPAMFDEPFADASQIPSFLLANLARRHVTVSLSGDGGDELFAGYDRYWQAERLWQGQRYLPRGLRVALGNGLLAVSNWADGRIATLPGGRLRRLSGFLRAREPEEMYRVLVSHWCDPAPVVGGVEPPTAFLPLDAPIPTMEVVPRLMALDAITYLPDDVMVKVDRTAMAVGLETRAPLLDHQVVEFAWRLPLILKSGPGHPKRLLRGVLHRHVPAALVDRPKKGFGVPIGRWLRNELRDWAEDLLEGRSLAADGIFEPGAIKAAWSMHLRGERDHQYPLWDVLMFQAWRRSGVPATLG